MKHATSFILTALICLVSFTGCKKETVGYGTMTAVVNADEFSAPNCSVFNTGGGWYLIKGTSKNSGSIAFYIKAAGLNETTYTFDDSMLIDHAIYDDATKPLLATGGSLTIKSIKNNESVTGTFNLTCVDGTVIVDGRFTAVY